MPIQIPIGAEDNFLGVIDLVTMGPSYWDDDWLGVKFTYEDIPAHLQEL